MKINGKYTDADIKTEDVDSNCIDQIQTLINHEAFTNPVKVMPDAHAGAGAVIGFTMEVDDKVCPNTVGVDIGCGMLSYKLSENVEPRKFVVACNQAVPMGRERHNNISNYKALDKDFRDQLETTCDVIDYSEKVMKESMGTLGGGNHFIELGEDSDGNHWITIHSGSRGFGFNVSKHYQDMAIEEQKGCNTQEVFDEEDLKYIKDGEVDYEAIRQQCDGEKIERTIDRLNSTLHSAQDVGNEDLAYLTGQAKDDYLYDMRIAQKYADKNRRTMLDNVLENLGIEVDDLISSPHNFISPEDNIVRKGATPAHEGQRGIVPLNMADGSIIIEGKGNPDWNYSAPHGAGRRMSRNEAKSSITVKDFAERMNDVFSININKNTLDEAPQAYKDIATIMDVIEETAEVKDRLESVANVKADN